MPSARSVQMEQMELSSLCRVDLRDPIYLCVEQGVAFTHLKALEPTRKMP